MMDHLDVAVYSDRTAFAELRGLWHTLLPLTSCDSVFCTPEWLDSWWQVFGGDRPLHVVTFRQGSSLAGLAPLMRSCEDGERCLCFIGGLDVTDYFDLLAVKGAESAVYGAFLDHIATLPEWDVVDLHSVRGSSTTVELLPTLAEARGYAVTVRQEEVCPVIELPTTWDAYVDSLGKKDRHELRRKLRRLQSEATWSLRTAREPSEIPEALADFKALHALSGPDKAGFWNETRGQFFNINAEQMLAAGWLRLSFLEINGKPAAALYAYDYGDTLSLYNSGYDPAFSYFSVGVIQVALSIQEAIAGGKRRYDFLRGNEAYKYTFGPTDRPIFNVMLRRGQEGKSQP
jgi:CelD/BcsL family acetyltransferase involved in cellulose biosynthesis